MNDYIYCPHCNGSGKVPEDFLTDDHVSEVFKQYCTVFNIGHAYGVEKWEDNGGTVRIVQDISSRGCYDNESHSLPRPYFTRDVAKRATLMKADFDKMQAKKVRELSANKRAELLRARELVAKLERELG